MPFSGKMETRISTVPIDYPVAVDAMQERVAAIHAGTAPEMLWLLEHPSLYTAGTSAQESDLLARDIPVFQSGRGGQYTWHGPGQRVGYVMLNLGRDGRAKDVRRYVYDLEEWLIRSLADFEIIGERREGRVGIWVDLRRYGRFGEAKIAAIGVRLTRWVTWHGVAINNFPDLTAYQGIVPCGIRQHGVTSLANLGMNVTMEDLDATLQARFNEIFGV